MTVIITNYNDFQGTEFLHLFGNQHLSISLVLCQNKNEEWILEYERTELKLLDFSLGSEMYSQEFPRNLEMCKIQKDNSDVRWYINKHNTKFFTQQDVYPHLTET